MAVVAIDTFEVVKELRAAGFTEAQAEAVTRVVRNAQDIDLSNLATRADLLSTKTDLQLEMAALKAELQRSIAESKAEILKWLLGAVGLQTLVIIGVLRHW